MNKTKPKKENEGDKTSPSMPFDEALKRVWNAPPKHKAAKKKEKPEK